MVSQPGSILMETQRTQIQRLAIQRSGIVHAPPSANRRAHAHSGSAQLVKFLCAELTPEHLLYKLANRPLPIVRRRFNVVIRGRRRLIYGARSRFFYIWGSIASIGRPSCASGVPYSGA